MKVRIHITGKRKIELIEGHPMRPIQATFADVRMDGAHPRAVARQLREIADDIERNGKP